jgi:hypothetical protein
MMGQSKSRGFEFFPRSRQQEASSATRFECRRRRFREYSSGQMQEPFFTGGRLFFISLLSDSRYTPNVTQNKFEAV